MGDAFVFAFTAALNPTLLAATMAMLFADDPRRLMGGYLLGAYTVSISIGLVIVFALQGSSVVHTTAHTLSPAADVVLGVLCLVFAAAVHGGRGARIRERRQTRAHARATKPPPLWKRTLDRGTAGMAFGVGVLLTLPGASYLIGMTRIAKAQDPAIAQALAVVAFCVVMLALIEIPLLGFLVRPDGTRRAVERFTSWVRTDIRKIVTRTAVAVGALLLVRAALTLVG